MKVVFQSYRDGEVRVVDVPEPAPQPGRVLVRNRRSLISAGTERSVLEMGRKSIVGKAAERPDLARKVFEKARRDGIGPTVRSVLDRLDEPVPLGYSSAGTVVEVGEGAGPFSPGDPVACAGAGHASHAELVSVPRNLCARIPAEGIAGSSGEDPFEAGAFTTLGAIALQGVRVGDVRVGEKVAVVGLGLLGLLTVQILRAAGCRVVGMDPMAGRGGLAEELGAEAVASDAPGTKAAAAELTGGRGVDAVLITASTESSQPVELAAELCREKGTVVVVGAVGLEVPRAPYYEKELDLRFSRSYGPGRYDPDYEEKGIDYPYGYVRWTEQRNMEAFCDLLARGAVRTAPLVTHRFPVEEAVEAYDRLTEEGEAALAVLLTYPEEGAPAGEGSKATPGSGTAAGGGSGPAAAPEAVGEESARIEAGRAGGARPPEDEPLRVAFMGAGRFAGSTLLPALSDVKGVRLASVCTATGLSARRAAERFGFASSVTDPDAVFGDPDVDAVFVVTRHDLHAPYIVKALEAGKHVFCEKPLCLSPEELDRIREAHREAGDGDGSRPLVMVGFNRRFAPLTRAVREALGSRPGPLAVLYRVSAGRLPPDHWLRDPEVGGGRIVGEACHFVDWVQHLAGSPPAEVFAERLGRRAGTPPDEDVVITLTCEDGSVATVQYLAAGDPAAGKERIEVSGGDATAVIEDFRHGWLFRDGRRKRLSRRFFPPQRKGHEEELRAFVTAVREGRSSPVPLGEAALTTEATFAVRESLRIGSAVRVGGARDEA